MFIFHLLFQCKSDLRISCLKETMENISELNIFEPERKSWLPHFLSDSGFKVTIKIRTLSFYRGSLKIIV